VRGIFSRLRWERASSDRKSITGGRADGTEMITPYERLARMRKSFMEDKSVLIEDYKYFTTPDKTAKQRAEQPEQKPRKCQASR
jgi:hypothetical protein